MDRFTVGVMVAVALLIAAAVLVVNMGGAPDQVLAYREEDTPEAAVHNLVVAVLKEDATRIPELVTRETLDWWDERDIRPIPPLPELPIWDRENTRVRILKSEMVDPDHARVTLAVDHYSRGGLFDGDVWTDTVTLDVVREDGRWKVDLRPVEVKVLP